MGPVKFDDISKTANEVLNDDFQVKGYQFKGKQKTNYDGAVLSTQVDLWGTDTCKTPTKLTWKFPKPLGCTAFSVDKLEMDKTGGLKLEAVSDKVGVAGLKVNCKSDLAKLSKITAGCTYTGLKDTQVIFDTKLTSPQDFTCEVTRTQGLATCGVKFTPSTLSSPDLGVRFASGPFFAALVGKEKLSCWTASCHYKVNNSLRCAANYCYGGKTDGNMALAMSYAVKDGMNLKAKVAQDQSVAIAVKNVVSKGFTVVSGCRYEAKTGKQTFGLQLSIE